EGQVHDRSHQAARAHREQPDRPEPPPGHGHVGQHRQAGYRAQPPVVRPHHGAYRAETGDGLFLGLALGEPGGHPVGHALPQVVLGLGENPPALPRRAAQAHVELVEVVLDEVAGAGHALPPAVTSPPVTAWTPRAKRRHSPCSAASAVAPLLVSEYTRRRRPSTAAQLLLSRPVSSSRCSAGYTVPSGRSKVPALRWRSAEITAYPCAGPAASTDSSSRSRCPLSRTRFIPSN